MLSQDDIRLGIIGARDQNNVPELRFPLNEAGWGDYPLRDGKRSCFVSAVQGDLSRRTVLGLRWHESLRQRFVPFASG